MPSGVLLVGRCCGLHKACSLQPIQRLTHLFQTRPVRDPLAARVRRSFSSSFIVSAPYSSLQQLQDILPASASPQLVQYPSKSVARRSSLSDACIFSRRSCSTATRVSVSVFNSISFTLLRTHRRVRRHRRFWRSRQWVGSFAAHSSSRASVHQPRIIQAKAKATPTIAPQTAQIAIAPGHVSEFAAAIRFAITPHLSLLRTARRRLLNQVPRLGTGC